LLGDWGLAQAVGCLGFGQPPGIGTFVVAYRDSPLLAP